MLNNYELLHNQICHPVTDIHTSIHMVTWNVIVHSNNLLFDSSKKIAGTISILHGKCWHWLRQQHQPQRFRLNHNGIFQLLLSTNLPMSIPAVNSTITSCEYRMPICPKKCQIVTTNRINQAMHIPFSIFYSQGVFGMGVKQG